MGKSEKHINLSDEEDDGAERRVWTNEEDNAIREMVQKYGTKSWAQISEKLSKECGIAGRSGKQCRERWHNHLDPHINKTNWTEEEERIMSEAHKELGNKWSDIAKRLPGRTDNHVKNHWYSFMRRNVRKLNKQIGKHVSQYATIPVPLQPLPMTYEPQAPTDRKGSYNKKSSSSSSSIEHIETGPTLSISAVSMKPDEVAMETMFNTSSNDGVKVSTSLLDSPSRNADIGVDKSYNMDEDEVADSNKEEHSDPILKMIADVAEQRQNAMRGNNVAASSSAAIVQPTVTPAPVSSAQKTVEKDEPSPVGEESTSATKPPRKKKQSVRKAVNLAELRRYYQAAEEAAREIMVEQYGDAIKETGEEGEAAAAPAPSAPKEDGVYQLSTIGPLPLKSPKRLIALQMANNNPFFRERLKQKLQESATVRNDSDSKYLDDVDEKGKRKRGRKKLNHGDGDSSDAGDHVGSGKKPRTSNSAVGRVLNGIVRQVAVLNGEETEGNLAESAADDNDERGNSNKKNAAGRHGYAEAHNRNDDSAYENKKSHETTTKPPKTKTLKAVVGKVLDKIVNKVIALNNLETARAFTNSLNPNSTSILKKSKRGKFSDGGEEDHDGADDSFDRKTSKLPISKLANKILRNNYRLQQDQDDEPSSSFQSLHKQLKKQQLDQKQVELDVSRMTKRQIAAAYARNVLLVEQLKEQQRQYQQQQLFARTMHIYGGEGDETVIFEGLDGPSHHNPKYAMNNNRKEADNLGATSHGRTADNYSDAAADPFEDSGDSDGDDEEDVEEEEEEEQTNLNSKHRKIKKSQDIYYNRPSKPAGDGSAPKRGRPRKTVEFSAPPKQDKSSRLSNDSAFSDGSLSPRSLSRRQKQQEEIDSSMDTAEYSAFDALTAAVNRESGDMQVKRKRGRPPKEKSDSSSSGAMRKSNNPFAIPISRNSWGNDAMMMLGVSDSGSYGNEPSKGDGSIIKRRRLGELKIMVDGSATGNSRNNLHSLVGGGINGLNSLGGGGLNTAGLSDMGPPDDTPRRSYRLQSNTAANAGMGPLTVNTMFGLDLPSPFALDKGQGMFPDLFGIADTPSNIMPFDPPTVKNSGGSAGNASAHSSGGSARNSMGQHPLNGGPDSVRFDFEDVVSKHFPSPRAGEELKGSSPFRWSAGSAGSAPGGMFNFPDTSFPASNSSNNITTNIANSSSYSAHNSLDCIADAAIIQQQQQQEQESQMQEDIYAKKFKKAHRRLKIDSDGPAVIPDAVAAEKESGSARRAAPAELDVDDEQTTELLQSFPIDTPKILEMSMSLKP